ncbi:MAG: hypothetical protein NUV80_05665 [Candidatus Berkelbacteria bacterium]|nr:hypothetical protein [Candidatus Berkelbacteria bacterium]
MFEGFIDGFREIFKKHVGSDVDLREYPPTVVREGSCFFLGLTQVDSVWSDSRPYLKLYRKLPDQSLVELCSFLGTVNAMGNVRSYYIHISSVDHTLGIDARSWSIVPETKSPESIEGSKLYASIYSDMIALVEREDVAVAESAKSV